MHNTKSSRAFPALVAPTTEPDVHDRVIAISPAPLLPGEKEADYASLSKRIVGAAMPNDTIEELLIRDVIDLSWEILRLRRAKGGILKTSMNIGVERVLDAVDYGRGKSYKYSEELSKMWMAGDKSARKEVEAALHKAQLSVDDVTAKTLECKLDSFERLDRMLASAEARRNNALREIDRHRSALGVAVRQAIDEAEDVEFRDVETGEVMAESQP